MASSSEFSPRENRAGNGNLRWFLCLAAIVSGIGGTFYFGRYVTAMVNGDVLLTYQQEHTIRWDVDEINAELHVWNAGLADLEIIGLSSPCPSCIEVDEIPTAIPAFQSRRIMIKLPVRHLPTEKDIPFEFRLLCDRNMANTEFAFTLHRQSMPQDNRVPTLAPPKHSDVSVLVKKGESDHQPN